MKGIKETVYVIGHKRPDTDSISAAIAYSYLKEKLDPTREYIPARTGPVNPETAFVLSTFGVEKPMLIEHVHIQVKDAMTKEVVVARDTDTIYEVGNLMLEKGIRTLPIVDEDGEFIGLVTERKIARSFLKEFRNFTLEEFPPKVKDILRTMDGKLLSGDPDMSVKGRPMIGAMSAEYVRKLLRKGDVLITGNREDIQKIGIEIGVSCLIVTGGISPSEEIVNLAREKNVPLVLTIHNTYVAGRLLRLSSPVLMVTSKSALTVSPEVLLKDFEPDLMEDRDGVAVVIDKNGKVVGIITRHDLINPSKKKVILVDHSEKALSVDGIEEAEILEIIDHHRLGGIETGHPLTVHVKPLGSTCTIIWQLFKSSGIEIPKEIAGIMMGAILSDTLILKSPTTTEIDRKALNDLSSMLKINPTKFGIDMFRAKYDPKNLSISELITMDLKELHFTRGKVAIAQLELIQPKLLLERKGDILSEMEKISQERGYILYIFMLTDVMESSSTLLVAGNKRIAEKAFKKKVENGEIFLEGVVSRKKQVIPRIYEVM